MEVLAFLFGCGGLFLGFAVALLIGSVILRAAVALANRFLGPPVQPDTFGQWDDWDSDEPGPRARKARSRLIPEPSLAIGMLVTFAVGIAGVFGYAVLGVITDELFGRGGPDEPLLVLFFIALGLPVTALALTLTLVLLLPTTFTRAALVAFIHHFVVVAGAVVIAVVVTFAWAVLVG
ncbi:MAG TPA: hypothetical protein VGE74_11855 [Gemmata sp.]